METNVINYAQKMGSVEKDALINRLLNAQKTETTGMSSYAKRTEAMVKEAQYDNILAKNLATATGLKKIAANLANPVRQQLDFRGIGRKFGVVEQIPDMKYCRLAA